MNFFPLIDSPEAISPFIIEKINDILHSNARITLIPPKILSIHYRRLNFIPTRDIMIISDCLHKSFLHKDLHLERSKSFCDLTNLHKSFLHKDLHLERSKSFGDLRLLHHCASFPLQHSHSCPDLSGIHHMHPQLHGMVIRRTTDSSEEIEVPVGLQKCKTFIRDYWTGTVPAPFPKM